jgi:toxin-antitoxin system PIN domain toxin
VKLPDANVLLYALDDTSARHAGSKAWLDEALSGSEEVGFAWVVLLAVLRLTTKPSVFARPLRTAEAFDIIDDWLAQPCALVLNPTVRHAALMRGFLTAAGTAGNLTTDAHLAALSVEYGAEICSYDADFSRFPGVQLTNPDKGI